RCGGQHMTRRRLPNRRASESFALEANGMRFTATISRFDSGELAEIFLTNHRQGSDADAAACDSAVLASLLMQHGVSVDQIRRSLMRDSRGQPRTPLGIVLDRIAAEVKP